MRLFALAFLMFFAFGQQSQPPSPTPTKPAHSHQAKGNSKENKPSSNDDATKQLTSAINQLSAEIATRNQQQLTEQRNKKPPPDWWSRVSTVLITLFTLALAVLAYLQWTAMHRQADIGEEQAKIADKQTEITDKQREIAAEQLAITKAVEVQHEMDAIRERRRADERYAEQITLASANAAAAKQSADAALELAQATKRSVKLQENTQRQWVILKNWNAFRVNHNDPLEVAFDVVNPTNLPLTLHGIITTVNGKRVEDEVPIKVLTPSYPFKHGVGVPLDKEQESLYTRDALNLEIGVTVLFADSHGIHWRHQFGRMLLCSRTGNVVTDTNETLTESGLPGERGSRDVELPK